MPRDVTLPVGVVQVVLTVSMVERMFGDVLGGQAYQTQVMKMERCPVAPA